MQKLWIVGVKVMYKRKLWLFSVWIKHLKSLFESSFFDSKETQQWVIGDMRKCRWEVVGLRDDERLEKFDEEIGKARKHGAKLTSSGFFFFFLMFGFFFVFSLFLVYRLLCMLAGWWVINWKFWNFHVLCFETHLPFHYQS